MGLQSEICIYCQGRNSSRKGDHIPPQCFFRKNRHQELIQVPCCEICNNSYSKQDEKIRNLLVLLESSENNTVVKEELQDAVNRAWEKAEGKKIQFIKDFIDMDSIPRQRMSFEEFEKLDLKLHTNHDFHLFIGRISKALTYAKYKLVTPSEVKVKWGFIGGSDEPWVKSIEEVKALESSVIMGENVFEYSIHWNKPKHTSICWFRFYGGLELWSVLALRNS